MRTGLLICGLCGLLLIGCNQNSQPKSGRGAPSGGGNAEIPLKSNNPHAELFGQNSTNDGPFDDSGGPVKVGAITLTAPKGWKRKKPASSFIQAEYVLASKDGGDKNGRLTLSQVGGSMQANIDRWVGQFGRSPESNKQSKIDVGKLTATLVDLSGEFLDQRGPFAPAVKRPGYRMIAAIIPVNGQLHFIKAIGPHETMESHADAIKSFVKTAEIQ